MTPPGNPADPDSYLADFCRLAQVEWPANRTLQVVCHGHSVPAGYFKTPDVRTFESYPHLLHRGLKYRFPCAVFNVTVTAIGGENAQAGAQRFERDVLVHRPDVLTLDYGLNDRRIGLDAARTAWVSMIETALAQGIKIILLTPSADMTASLSNPTEPLNQHAEQIRALAGEYKLGLADSLAEFASATSSGVPIVSLMSQANHPNLEGHQLIARRLLQWFPPPPRAAAPRP